MQNYLASAMPILDYLVFQLLAAIALLVLGWAASNLAGRVVRKVMLRVRHIDPTVIPVVKTATVWLLRVFVVIAVLARFGVQTASLIAVLGAAGLAIGLALQSTLQNVAAGLMLLILRPLRAGESVSIVGKAEGVVEEIGLFLTRVVQADGVVISLPNSLIWGSPIMNYSRSAVSSRVEPNKDTPA